jgi:ABC-type transport system involved in multi-copper enzyme maturation permease subunit
MTQTWAMVLDAYRELNARKLFWVTMGLSGLIVVALACLGINDKGPTILWFQVPVDFISTQFLDRQDFYKILFISVGFGLWLSWAAMILALISTANIMPDFVSGGAIELTLSKPISRLRLFLTKYACALLFVALQVAVFSLGAFLVIGIRGNSWEPRIFLAVPIITLVFSYLYCVSTLVGIVTRSGMAALIVTGLIWVAIFSVHVAESGILLRVRTQYDIAESLIETERASRVKAIAAAEQAAKDAGDPPVPAAEQTTPAPSPTASAATKPDEAPAAASQSTKPAWSGMDELAKSDPVAERASTIRRLRKDLENFDTRAPEAIRTAQNVRTYHAIAFAVKTVLPKTSETMSLLQRNILQPDALTRLMDEDDRRSPNTGNIVVGPVRVSGRQINDELQKALDSRSVAWIAGTSVLFQAVVLGAACLIFIRRDF